jgi:hypothetical protein
MPRYPGNHSQEEFGKVRVQAARLECPTDDPGRSGMAEGSQKVEPALRGQAVRRGQGADTALGSRAVSTKAVLTASG